MTSPSQKLRLALPTQTDPFSTSDIKKNWEAIDAAPGSYICTSSTRPTWTAAQAGRKIIETNTELEWMWNGTDFVRLAATGLLKRSNGDWAIGERTTGFSTSSTTYVKAVSVTSVVVPAGRRPIRIECSWTKARFTKGNFYGAIFRSNTSNSGPRLAGWNFGTSADDANAGGGVFWCIERAGLAAGTYDFSMQVMIPSNVSGTAYVDVSNVSPITIMVTEV